MGHLIYRVSVVPGLTPATSFYYLALILGDGYQNSQPTTTALLLISSQHWQWHGGQEARQENRNGRTGTEGTLGLSITHPHSLAISAL